MKQSLLLLALALAAGGLAAPAQAMRSFDAIDAASPAQARDAKETKNLGDVGRERVQSAVQAVAEAWNNGDMDRVLLPDFQDRQRLLDTLDQSVPRDARLTILSVDGITTLRESTELDAVAGSLAIRTVSAIVRSQIEFDDPVTGHQRLEGRYEWILRFRDSLGE